MKPNEQFKRNEVQEAPAMTTRKNILAAMVGLAMLAMPVRALAGDNHTAIGMTIRGRKRGTTRAGITDGTRTIATGTTTGPAGAEMTTAITNRHHNTRMISTKAAVITVEVTRPRITVRASDS